MDSSQTSRDVRKVRQSIPETGRLDRWAKERVNELAVALRASFGGRKVRLAGRATVILPADQSVLTIIIDTRKWQESRSHCTLSGFQLRHLDYVAALVDHAARQVVEQPIA